MEDCSEDWNREAFSKGHVCGPRSDVRQSWPARLGWLAFCGTKLRVTPGKKLLPPLLGSASCPGNIPCLHPSERISPYRRNRINIVRMSCRPICLPSRNRRREERKERRESKLEWWGSAGGGISRRGRVDRDRSERVPLCIPAKFGLSNHVSPTLLPSRTRGADHPDIRSESREMIWQRSNRSSGEGFAGPDPTSPAPFQPESLSFPTANTQDILGSAKIRSPMDGKNGYPSFPKNETR